MVTCMLNEGSYLRDILTLILSILNPLLVYVQQPKIQSIPRVPTTLSLLCQLVLIGRIHELRAFRQPRYQFTKMRG